VIGWLIEHQNIRLLQHDLASITRILHPPEKVVSGRFKSEVEKPSPRAIALPCIVSYSHQPLRKQFAYHAAGEANLHCGHVRASQEFPRFPHAILAGR